MATDGAYPHDTEMVQAVQQYLAAVGVKATIQTVAYSTYISLVHKRTGMNKPMFIDAWGDVAAAFILRDRYDCPTATTGTVNMDGYCSPTVGQLINNANMQLNDTTRNAELKQAQEQIAKAAPSLWGVVLDTSDAFSPEVHGIVRTDDESAWADQNTWISK